MKPKVRALALATGVVVGVTGCLGIGLFFVVVPALLIIGTLVQPRSDAGRPLMWAGALFVSIPGLFFGYSALHTFSQLPKYHDVGLLTMVFLSLLSFFLVVACDLTLIMDALRFKRRQVP
ncbi:MAG TPA: hypothetical protein VIY69_04985 [Candidatus Acidoferrales bacterium]